MYRAAVSLATHSLSSIFPHHNEKSLITLTAIRMMSVGALIATAERKSDRGCGKRSSSGTPPLRSARQRGGLGDACVPQMKKSSPPRDCLYFCSWFWGFVFFSWSLRAFMFFGGFWGFVFFVGLDLEDLCRRRERISGDRRQRRPPRPSACWSCCVRWRARSAASGHRSGCR